MAETIIDLKSSKEFHRLNELLKERTRETIQQVVTNHTTGSLDGVGIAQLCTVHVTGGSTRVEFRMSINIQVIP